MRRSISVTPKKRGRPATGRDPLLTARLPQPMIDSIEVWARRNECSRSEAIRRLVELGLLAKDHPSEKPKPAGKRSAVDAAKMITAAGLETSKRSSQMAGEAIDRLGDASATVDERARRKRRLIKGPSEFREMRAQKPKAKG